MNNQPSDYLPIIVQLGAALAFIFATMAATHWLGPKRHSKLKDDAFECGIESIGDARTPISVKYFLVAILFVLFDVEIIFMYPWAVNFMGWIKSSSSLAIDMFLEMLVFMGLLLIGFIYVIKKGVLTWEK
jgi:NADH-quinone oxidoreductase subunit A